MPSYDYVCCQCGHEFVKFFMRIVSEKEEVRCPKCDALCERLWGKGSFGIIGCPNTKG